MTILMFKIHVPEAHLHVSEVFERSIISFLSDRI